MNTQENILRIKNLMNLVVEQSPTTNVEDILVLFREKFLKTFGKYITKNTNLIKEQTSGQSIIPPEESIIPSEENTDTTTTVPLPLGNPKYKLQPTYVVKSRNQNPNMDTFEIYHRLVNDPNYRRDEYNITTKKMTRYEGKYLTRTTNLIGTFDINITKLPEIIREFIGNAGVINISGVKYQLTAYSHPWDSTTMVAPASSILKGKLGETQLSSLNYVITKSQ
jgi:hypothetical protein